MSTSDVRTAALKMGDVPAGQTAQGHPSTPHRVLLRIPDLNSDGADRPKWWMRFTRRRPARQVRVPHPKAVVASVLAVAFLVAVSLLTSSSADPPAGTQEDSLESTARTPVDSAAGEPGDRSDSVSESAPIVRVAAEGPAEQGGKGRPMPGVKRPAGQARGPGGPVVRGAWLPGEIHPVIVEARHEKNRSSVR